MNAEQIEQLRRRMGEVAALPHDDPDRQALVCQISRIDGAMEREWIELVREDERLRLELARVAPPPDLEQRLLAIAEQARPRRRWVLDTSQRFAAAAAILLVVLVLIGVSAAKNYRVTRTLDEIATLAMASHETGPELAVRSSDWQVIRAALADSVYYPVDRPRLDPSFRLIGGSVVRLAGASMVYTRWERGARTYSLYQFCGEEFGLRFPLEAREIRPVPIPKAACKVIIWTEAHCDYALVTDADAPVGVVGNGRSAPQLI